MRWIDLLTLVNTIDGFVEGALLVQSCNLVKEIKFREVNFEVSWYLCTYIVVSMVNNRMTKTVSWHTTTTYIFEEEKTMRKHFTTSSYFYSWNVMSFSKILTYYIVKQTFTTTTYFWSNVISCYNSLFYYIVRKYFTTCGDISKIFQKSKAHCLM